MARTGKIKQEEILQETPASLETAESTVIKSKRGRPKQTRKVTKSKPNNKKKESMPKKGNKAVTIQVPSELLDFISGEALAHFLAAKKSFLLGLRSLIDKNLEGFTEKKNKMPPQKKLKRIKVEEDTLK